MTSSELSIESDPFTNPKNSEERDALAKVHGLMEGDELMKRFLKYKRDDVILMNVRSKGCDARKAFHATRSLYLCIVEKYPDLFAKADPKALLHVFEAGIFDVVNTGEGSPVIVIVRLKNWKPNEVSSDELIAAATVLTFSLVRTSMEAQEIGMILVFDMEGFGFTHARHINYDVANKVIFCIAYASPIKFLGFIHMNSHMLFEKVFSLLKYAIPESGRKQVHVVRKDLSPLHKLVPDVSLLPSCLGGKVPNNIGLLDMDQISKELAKDGSLAQLIRDVQKDFGIKTG